MSFSMREAVTTILKTIIKVTAAGVISLFLLSLFCLVYLNTGVHIQNKTGATDYKWESNQKKASMVEGFSWLTIDGYGFNNAFPAQENIDILLMGSSHMEALNVPADKNVGYLLNEMLPEFYTYNIGISGHTIYACANNLKAAIKYYQPQRYTIIETDRIDLDIGSIEKIISGEYEPIKCYDSGFIYIIQKYFPVIKNLYKQVDDWWNSDFSISQSYKTVENRENAIVSDDYIDSLDCFLSYIRAGSTDCKLMIVYQPSTVLASDGSLLDACDSEKLAVFSQLCEKNGILFVDATSAFETLYQQEHILAHGFINTGVGVGHLNEYGHKAIAEVVAQAIKGAQ